MNAPTTAEPFCLVMVVWGDVYHTGYIKTLADSVLKSSKRCDQIILFTDRTRPGLPSTITQIPIPPDLMADEYFRPGYPVKLCLADQRYLPANKICIYMDLDTLILGDVDRIAALCDGNDHAFILPPSIGNFGWVSRVRHGLSGGKKGTVGNSSILAFRSNYGENIPERYIRETKRGTVLSKPWHHNDDSFLSHCLHANLRNLPAGLCQMFRREYLSKFRVFLPLKAWHRQSKSLVAVTLNDEAFKPHHILAWSEGQEITERKGRIGVWSETLIGPTKARITSQCQTIEAAQNPEPK